MNVCSINMARMARKAGSNAEVTKPRIRAAARSLIARHGYAAVSMRQIAGEADIQAGTIYLYFKDKQALLFELMDDHMDELLAAWGEVKRQEAPDKALRAFTDFHIGFNIDRPDSIFIAYMELRSLSPENFAVIERKRRAYEAELEAILTAGVEAETFNLSDIRLTTMAIIAMLTGVNTWYNEGGRLTRLNVQRIYWRLVRRMVSGVRRD